LKPTHKNVAVEFADLLNKVRASNNSYGESTMNLKRSFGKVSPQFTGYD
jgi:hypothetical protein